MRVQPSSSQGSPQTDSQNVGRPAASISPRTGRAGQPGGKGSFCKTGARSVHHRLGSSNIFIVASSQGERGGRRVPRGGWFQQTGSAPAGVTWAAGVGGWGPGQGEPAAWAADWRGAGRSAALLAAVVGLFLRVCRGGGWQLGMQLTGRNWQRWRLQAIATIACVAGPQQRRPGSAAQQFGRVHRAGP